jgi:predicted nucleotidyltransferase
LEDKENLDLKNLTKVIQTLSKVNKIILFGSRAIGNARLSSDWDFALFGSDITTKDILSLQVKIEDLWLPNTVDLIDYNSIKNEALREHIDRVGLLVWSRS